MNAGSCLYPENILKRRRINHNNQVVWGSAVSSPAWSWTMSRYLCSLGAQYELLVTFHDVFSCKFYLVLFLHNPPRPLRSSTQKLLQVSYVSTDFGRRAFSYSSPATSNSVLTAINNCSSLYSFKRHLKSHLIAQLINNPPATWRLPAPPIHI